MKMSKYIIGVSALVFFIVGFVLVLIMDSKKGKPEPTNSVICDLSNYSQYQKYILNGEEYSLDTIKESQEPWVTKTIQFNFSELK